MKSPLASWWVILLLCAIAVPHNGAAKKPGGIWQHEQGTVKSCDDYEENEEVTAEGAMTFLGPMLCEKPLVFNVYNDTAVRSRHIINTTNVHFVVHPKATLTMKARVISMGRDEASTRPVVKVFGKVKIEARSWTPSYVNGAQEDNGGVVRVFKGGMLDSNQPVRFTTSSFVVATEQARDDKTPLSNVSPHLDDLLTEFHARDSAKAGTPNSSASSSTPTTATTEGLRRSRTTDTSSSSSSSDADADASAGTPVGRRGIEAARKTSSVFLPPQNLTLNHRVSKRIHELETVNLKKKIENNAAPKANNLRGSASNHLILKSAMLCPKTPWVKKLACALHVGLNLTGSLRSPEGRSVLWPGVDGSFNFGKYQETPSTEEVGRGGEEAMRLATLLQSDLNAVREVFGMRRSKARAFGGKGGNDSERKMGTAGGWLPLGQQQSEKKSMDDLGASTDSVGSDFEIARKVLGMQTAKVRDVGGKGNDDEPEAAMGTAGGWLPWARRDKTNRLEDIESATDKMGEKVTVDGIPVPSESAPYAWGWLNRLPWTRPTDEGYEAHVAEDGMEVRLGERTVWGVNAEEWMG